MSNYEFNIFNPNDDLVWGPFTIRLLLLVVYIAKLRDENTKIAKPESLIVVTTISCLCYYWHIQTVYKDSVGEINLKIMDRIIFGYELVHTPVLFLQTFFFFRQIKKLNEEERGMTKLKVYMRNKTFD